MAQYASLLMLSLLGILLWYYRFQHKSLLGQALSFLAFLSPFCAKAKVEKPYLPRYSGLHSAPPFGNHSQHDPLRSAAYARLEQSYSHSKMCPRGGTLRCCSRLPECLVGLLHFLYTDSCLVATTAAIEEEDWRNRDLHDWVYVRNHASKLVFLGPKRLKLTQEGHSACVTSLLGLVYRIKLLTDSPKGWDTNIVGLLRWANPQCTQGFGPDN